MLNDDPVAGPDRLSRRDDVIVVDQHTDDAGTGGHGVPDVAEPSGAERIRGHTGDGDVDRST